MFLGFRVGRETVEASVQYERSWRPTKGRPSFRILAMCEVDVETARHFSRFSESDGINRADGRIIGTAANCTVLLFEHEVEEYLGFLSDSAVAV